VALTPLIEWGRLTGLGDPIPAVSAILTIDVTVLTQGGTLNSGTQLISITNGVTYSVNASVPLTAATVTAEVTAVSHQAGGNGSGDIGNLVNGSIMSFANPPTDVFVDAVVTATTTEGEDRESEDKYRQRVLDKFQKRPQGGAYADYQAWALEVAGIVNAYPYTGDAGEGNVYSESENDPDGIPSAGELQDVLDSIELDQAGLATRRPANAAVNSLAITRTPFDVEVYSLDVDNIATVKDTIITALEEYFVGREPFIPGLSVPPRVDRITSFEVGGVVADVVSAAGGVFANVIVKQGVSVVSVYQLGEGEKAKADSVVFI
jgi:uncharacterized phage protein gp47/JayE